MGDQDADYAVRTYKSGRRLNTFDIPIPSGTDDDELDGSILYFGVIVDEGREFDEVEIILTSGSNDEEVFGFDDFTLALSSQLIVSLLFEMALPFPFICCLTLHLYFYSLRPPRVVLLLLPPRRVTDSEGTRPKTKSKTMSVNAATSGTALPVSRVVPVEMVEVVEAV